MLLEILGVVKLVVPVPPLNILPVEETEYQSIVSPAPGVALIETVPVPQREPFTAVGVDGSVLTVTVIVVGEPTQLPVEEVGVTTY